MAQSAATEKKPPLTKRISRGARDMLGEMKRVVWPSRKQTVNNTALVLIFMAVMAVVIGLFDAGLSAVIQRVFGS
jgi:preprotein translocase subunit SecE